MVVLNKDNFDTEISKGTVLVDFYADWCGPCKMLTPILEEMDEKGAFGEIKILKVDVDECGDIARDFRIQAVPTLMFFKNGKLVNTTMGYKNENEILDFIK